tara:strand:+ start:1049 stop:1819 length:771 start_codon:yes stop_codon:yes gene_type:complete
MNEVLTSASAQNSAPNYATWTSYEDDIFAFYNLLMVFYGKPFGADNWTKVSKITELAERFKALPCLSSLLPMIYSTSPSLLESIDVNAHMILPIAAKLRNAVLFKECPIFVINPWSSKGSRIVGIEDQSLRALAREVFDEIDLKIGKALCSSINHAGSNYYSTLGMDAQKAWSTSLAQVPFPRFFRLGYRGEAHENVVAKLLKNNSALVCLHIVPGEAGKFDDYFLSVVSLRISFHGMSRKSTGSLLHIGLYISAH